MGRAKQRNVRVLDRSKNQGLKEAVGIKQEDFEGFGEGEEEDFRQLVDIGLDISTSIIGVTVLDSYTGDLISIEAIKLNKARFKDVWDKASHVKEVLAGAFDLTNYRANRVFVEEAAMRFSPGFSSANTLFALARFNGIVSYLSHELFGTKPIMVNVRSARKKLGIKINYKDKSKDTKTKVFDAVRTLNPDFPWEQHVAKTGYSKGQLVYGKHNFDMADAWVICRGGQCIHPLNPKRR